MVDETPISLLDLPQGIYDCRLAIEDCKEIKIVADGQVHILGATEVTLNHFTTLSQDYRRVTITNDIVPTAPLPCPNEECTVVCQAKHTFVSWPARLIFPLKKYFPGTSKTYSQESIDDIKDIWAKYFFSQIEDEEEDSEDNDNMDVPPA
ncbi:hypothetical protein KSS87_019212 [Heliosperma pusillum]|nr:hypothetical protein KSS87_019212 [Heliosperma pusillum]